MIFPILTRTVLRTFGGWETKAAVLLPSEAAFVANVRKEAPVGAVIDGGGEEGSAALILPVHQSSVGVS